MKKLIPMLGVVLCYGLCSQAYAGDITFIAGEKPYERPANAPMIVETGAKKPTAWYDNAVTGITTPYPYSLSFLDNQGNWYTPFNHPGMTSGYDIRNWHK
ncbi:hypothetical protein [Candidatus Albibeggiatoa sp. nov. NOAA]|uniref:hypothetical protein n=1 Tax=Candidatus Albibeggiatoa sp. nov. NOAA TaxID=3162724 RepID=UPI0032F29259|nr:hypothetical protein [Thiotrichaceae bacterium]